ncbi:MAG: type II secretion system F family protein [Marinobacter sp.]|nr:type II secretion system F family protein [Marinobacter sp.]
MTAPAWFHAAIVCGGLALFWLCAQWLWIRSAGKRYVKRATRERLLPQTESASFGGARIELGPVERLLVQADIQWTTQQFAVVGAALAGLLIVLFVTRGAIVLLVTLFFVATLAGVFWRVRFQKQRQRIHEELPGIIDSTLRNIDAGRSLEQSLIASFSEASPVFEPLLFRLRNAVESGREYTGLFEGFAALYRTPSLILVAIALRTTSRFGASIRPVLRQVADSLRSQQELRQEFLAATAETRFTAVTFAVLPPGLAAYMVLMNEQYSDLLLNTATGHKLLIIAAVLQVVGMGVIWRMIQGVGRA